MLREMLAIGKTLARASRRALVPTLILGLGMTLAPPAQGEGVPRKLKTLSPHQANLNYYWEVAELGDALYFLSDNIYYRDLWKTDGTAAGTELIKAGLDDGMDAYHKEGYLTAMNGALYFQAAGLWKSDGTTSGTTRLKGLAVNTANPHNLAAVNNTLFFAYNDGVTGEELWKTDGTAAGTVRVSDIRPGAASSDIRWIKAFNGMAVFTANSWGPMDLFKSDGTTSGTMQVRGIVDPKKDGVVQAEYNPGIVNGTLYFNGTDISTHNQLWKTDGTASGTVLVKNISPYNTADPFGYTNVNGTVFFRARSSALDFELWKTDGTEAGTTLVKDICAGTTGSSPGLLTNVNGTLFFVANDGVHGDELWKSDGTAAGTVMVRDLATGKNGNMIGHLLDAWGTLCFVAKDPVYGPALWKSDGTAAGTVKIGAIGSDGANSTVYGVKRHKGRIFFLVSGPISGMELWVVEQTAVPVEMSTFTAE